MFIEVWVREPSTTHVLYVAGTRRPLGHVSWAVLVLLHVRHYLSPAESVFMEEHWLRQRGDIAGEYTPHEAAHSLSLLFPNEPKQKHTNIFTTWPAAKSLLSRKLDLTLPVRDRLYTSESGFYRRQILTYKYGPFQCGDRLHTSESGVYIRRNEILMYKGDPGT